MTDGEELHVDDAGLDRLLKLATRPETAPGFEARLAQRMAMDGMMNGMAASNVITFRARTSEAAAKAPSRMLRWPFAAAMAASLVIGLWLGGSSQVSNLLDQASETALLDSGAGFAPAGLEELGTVDGDNLS